MKLLFYLTRYPGYGGIETVTSIISNELQRRGHEVEAVSHIQQENIPSNIKTYAFPERDKYDSHKNRLFFDQLLGNGKYDAIIFQDSYAPTEKIVVFGAIKHKVPLLVFEHSTPDHIFIQNYPPLVSIRGILARLNFTRILRYALRKRFLINGCRYYVVLSSGFKKELRKYVGRHNLKKVEVINNPMKLCDTVQIPKENIVLFVGRLVDTKRVDAMLDVWERLSKRLKDWKFIIVGDGPQRAILEYKATTAHLQNVEFVGFQDPTTYYQKSRIFLMMSKFEGWPMTLCEGMQHGCVPVAMDTFSSLRDIVTNGETGFVVNSFDADHFVECVERLALKAELFNYMSDNCRRSVQRFAANHIVDQWEKLLCSVVEKKVK